MTDIREPLGRIVREAWVAWAKEQPDPKPSWLVGWDELDSGQREVDMRIGHAVANYALTENAVTWGTTCTSCARVLDSACAETVRREQAEAKLAAIREVLTTSLTDTGDELGVLERPADDSAMLDRTLRLIGRFLAILGSEEGLREH